jgi:hypothetical protein
MGESALGSEKRLEEAERAATKKIRQHTRTVIRVDKKRKEKLEGERRLHPHPIH